MPNEIELKLRISAHDEQRLKDHPAIKRHLVGEPISRKLISIYYDTPDFALLDAGLNLRVRSMSGGWFQAIKSSGHSIGGLHQRLEWEDLLTKNEPDFNKITDPHLLNIFSDKSLREALKPIFVVDVMRTDWNLKFPDKTELEVSFDNGDLKICNTRVWEQVSPIQEVELELKGGKKSHLFELALALQETIPLIIENMSKAQRGYDYLRPLPTIKSQTFRPKHIGKNPSPKDLVQDAMSSIEMNQEILLKVNHTAAVYQMRLAKNQIVSAFSTLKNTKGLIDELNWLDLFLITPCNHYAYLKLLTILNGQRYQRLLLKIGAWLNK